MLVKRCKEYRLPFSFCSECNKFEPCGKECLRDIGCKAAVKLYKKYMRKGKEVLTDEPPKEDADANERL